MILSTYYSSILVLLLILLKQRDSQSTFFINLGQGTTATHGMYDLFCKGNISACHFKQCCPVGFHDQPEQKVLISSLQESSDCLRKRSSRSSSKHPMNCDAVRWMHNFQKRVIDMDSLVSSQRLNGIMDNPVTGISKHLINAIAPYKKIKFILTTREKSEWARRRQEEKHNGLYCKFNASVVTHRVSNPLADHLECVQAGIQQLQLQGRSSNIATPAATDNESKNENDHLDHVNSIDFSEIFESSASMNRSLLEDAFEHYNTVYIYDLMAHYFRSVGDTMRIGRNFLHVNYFNQSINFQKVDTMNQFDEQITAFLVANQ